MHKVKLDREKLKYVLLYVEIDSETQSMMLSARSLVGRQGNNLRAEETNLDRHRKVSGTGHHSLQGMQKFNREPICKVPEGTLYLYREEFSVSNSALQSSLVHRATCSDNCKLLLQRFNMIPR